MSWAPAIVLKGGVKAKHNLLRFSTYQEAQDNVEAYAKKHHEIIETAVFESSEAVTHAWHEGRLILVPNRKEMS